VTKRQIWAVSALLGAAIAGGIVGFAVGWKQGVRAGPVFDLFTAVQMSTYVSAMRSKGNQAAYEDALRSYVTFHEQAKMRDPDPSNQRMYSFDEAVALARLSELARNRGALDEATRIGREAEALCPKTGIRDCTLALLKEVVDFMDTGQRNEPRK
jgi:hypothetical protein